MWLYLPPTCCPSQPVSECSTKPSRSPLPLWATRVAQSATWRGKPRQPRLWLAAWKKGHFIRHLSGLTLPPSTAEAGAALWISSLRASRANPTASLARRPGTKTSAASGAATGRSSTAYEYSKKLTPPWLSLKTSGPGLLGESSTSAPSERSFQRWVIESKRRSLSLRQILAHHMRESGSSSWPTARAEDSESSGLRHSRGTADTLTAVTRLWATPRTPTGGAESTQRKKELGRRESGGGDLQAQVAALKWPTPAARDEKGENSQAHATRGRGHMSQLPNFAAHSRPHQTLLTGPLSSKEYHTLLRRLNPAFVNWLQGNVWWWTHPVPTNFGPREIRWWRFKLRQRLSFLLGVLGSSKYKHHT